MDFLKGLPIELFFTMIAFFGGTARYLSGYTNGVPFKFTVFLAGGIASGFSGCMFALFAASSTNVSQEMLFVFAGVGGYFGEQTLKYILESVTKKKQ